MKTKHFYFIFIFVLSINTFAQNVEDTTLVAYYSFNGDVLDASGNENHGTPYNLISTQDRYGYQDAAYEFTGNSSYTSIANTESLQSPDSQITMMAWINMYGWSKVGDSFNPVLMKSSSSGNAFQYRMCITPNGIGVSFNNWNTGATAEFDFKFFRWYFVAATFKADTLRYYLDGHCIGTIPFDVDMVQDTRPLEIGRDVPGIIEYFNGKIDEVRIYNRALMKNEINQFYDNYHPDDIFIRINNIADTLSLNKNRGLSWGDYDNDNDLDLYITNYEKKEFVV